MERSKPSSGARSFLPVLQRYVGRVYSFAYRVTNGEEEARGVTREVLMRAYAGRERMPEGRRRSAWLLKIAAHVLENRKHRGTRMTFDLLDDIIRTDPTQITRTGALSDPEHEGLLWELKQGCMTAVLSCLPPGERMAFIVSVMMGMRTAEAAAILSVSTSAFKVRLSRAKKKIAGYLAPRCEHVHPGNPCRCESRLGVALRKGFIQEVPGREVCLRPRPPAGIEPGVMLRDVTAIYQHMPQPGGLDGLAEQLEAELLHGEWD